MARSGRLGHPPTVPKTDLRGPYARPPQIPVYFITLEE